MSWRLACLGCWRATAPRRAIYRCAECDAEERPEWLRSGGGERRRLGERRESWWASLFAGDDDRTAGAAGEAPRCPRHPQTAVRLYCDCGRPLAERAALRSGSATALALAGPPGAGKTLLLISMMHELHGLEIDGRHLAAVGLDDTEERFHRLSSGLLDRGRRPAAAAGERVTPENDEEPAAAGFGWTISVDGGAARRRPELLFVDDVDGAAWGRERHVADPRLDRFLGHLRSVVFVIDGAMLAADLGATPADAWSPALAAGDRGAADRQWFSRLEERLGRRARQVDLALVVSKADALWHADEWRALRRGPADERRELVEELLRRSRRRDVLVEARQRFRRAELFAASSLGFLPAPEDVDAAGHLRRPPEPALVAEPLRWLLRQRPAFSPKGGRW